MADQHEILCINKSDRFNAHERIINIGGGIGVNKWRISQARAIQGIESGEWEFFVNRGGSSVDVIISTSQYGHKYLKTVSDGEQPNNLLSLPEC